MPPPTLASNGCTGAPPPREHDWTGQARSPHDRLERAWSELISSVRLRRSAKSALVEEALERRLNPEKFLLLDDALLRRLDEQATGLATLKRDTAINTEMISLFVRYFLTITPPLPDNEQQPARALGRRRFEVFVAQIGRRLASDRRLVSEVLESIADNNPDLFATASDDIAIKPRAASTAQPTTILPLKPNGQSDPSAEKQHG